MNVYQQMKRDRKKQIEEEKIFAAYQVYNMLGLLTLYEDLNCREKRINVFADGVQNRMKDYQSGKVTLNDMVNKLNEYGIYLENINWDGKRNE